MSIIIQKIEKYFEDCDYPVHFALECDGQSSWISVTRGRPEENSSRTEFFDLEDFENILHQNNLYGNNGLIKAERDRYKAEGRDITETLLHEMKIEQLIYGTLQKYIYQLLNGAIGKNFYPEIVPLPKHKEYFHLQDKS
jgi:hypothetical protein